MVMATTSTNIAEPQLLVDTYWKLVASSVGEQQSNTVRHFRKIKFIKNIIGLKGLIGHTHCDKKTWGRLYLELLNLWW